MKKIVFITIFITIIFNNIFCQTTEVEKEIFHLPKSMKQIILYIIFPPKPSHYFGTSIGIDIPFSYWNKYIGIGSHVSMFYIYDSLRIYKNIKIYLNPKIDIGFYSTKLYVEKLYFMAGSINIGYKIRFKRLLGYKDYIAPYLGIGYQKTKITTRYIDGSSTNDIWNIGLNYLVKINKRNLLSASLEIRIINDGDQLLKDSSIQINWGYKI